MRNVHAFFLGVVLCNRDLLTWILAFGACRNAGGDLVTELTDQIKAEGNNTWVGYYTNQTTGGTIHVLKEIQSLTKL